MKKTRIFIAIIIAVLSSKIAIVYAAEFTNNNTTYILESNLHAVRDIMPNNAVNKVNEELDLINQPSELSLYNIQGTSEQPVKPTTQFIKKQALPTNNNIVAKKAGFNIIKSSTMVEKDYIDYTSQSNDVNSGLSNKIYPVVKNKRFGNYGIVLDSIIVKISEPITNNDIDSMFVNFSNDLQKINHTSNGMLFFKVNNHTIAKILSLKSDLEMLPNIDWVSIEILEQEYKLN